MDALKTSSPSAAYFLEMSFVLDASSVQSHFRLDRLEDSSYQTNLEAVTTSLTSNEDSTKWLALRSLIVSMLAKGPRDRPTISEVVDELQAVSTEAVKQGNNSFFGECCC